MRCAAQQRVVGRVSARDNHPQRARPLVLCLRTYPSIEGGSARDIAPRLPAGVDTGIRCWRTVKNKRWWRWPNSKDGRVGRKKNSKQPFLQAW